MTNAVIFFKHKERKMVATLLLWKTRGETFCTVAMIQVGEWAHSGSMPLSNPLPPCLAFQRIWKHILPTDGRDGRPTCVAHRFLT